jgi:hypothetical protein
MSSRFLNGVIRPHHPMFAASLLGMAMTASVLVGCYTDARTGAIPSAENPEPGLSWRNAIRHKMHRLG